MDSNYDFNSGNLAFPGLRVTWFGLGFPVALVFLMEPGHASVERIDPRVTPSHQREFIH
jgi:hypothetical protein